MATVDTGRIKDFSFASVMVEIWERELWPVAVENLDLGSHPWLEGAFH